MSPHKLESGVESTDQRSWQDFLRNFVAVIVFGASICLLSQANSSQNANAPEISVLPEDRNRLIMVGGEANFIDTHLVDSVDRHERRMADDEITVTQWYVQLSPGADVHSIEQETGLTLGPYFPHHAWLMCGTRLDARLVAASDGVVWVGPRPTTHKLSEGLATVLHAAAAERADDPQTIRAGGGETRRARRAREARRRSLILRRRLLVVLVPAAHRRRVLCAADDGDSDTGGPPGATPPCADPESVAAEWTREMEAANLTAHAVTISDTKLQVYAQPDSLAGVLAWLGGRGEVLHVEHMVRYKVHNYVESFLLAEGPAAALATVTKPTSQDFLDRYGLNGTGQVVGVADSGIDYDNCFFWESKLSQVFPNNGRSPPFNSVDKSRRKIIGYYYYPNCTICGACPQAVPDDSKTFTANNGLIQSKRALTLVFPATNEVQLSLEEPRLYGRVGGAVKYNLQATTTGVPSGNFAPGAGAFDVSPNIQVFVVARSDLATFDFNNVQDQLKCLNDCSAVGNLLSTGDIPIPLRTSPGGYGFIIKNLGASLSNGDTAGMQILISGTIQFMSAFTPCGDQSDEQYGHGTHVAGTVAGAAATPPSAGYAAQHAFAAAYNGLAAGAQLVFTDIKLNADGGCNTPGRLCTRAVGLTPPADAEAHLFPDPYAAGARVHVNSWGCDVPSGEAASYCGKYTALASDIDSFTWTNKDFLVVTAVGDNGKTASDATATSPSTCKNCLSVGFTGTMNRQYREAVTLRDPLQDICTNCSSPRSCTGSDTINGKAVLLDKSNLGDLLKSVPKCCNDTIHFRYQLKDQLIPGKEVFSVFFPNRTIFDNGIQNLVKGLYGWGTSGSRQDYAFVATPQTFSTPSNEASQARIQVIVLARQDFYEYNEGGVLSCQDASASTSTFPCRPNPCVSDYGKRVEGSELCFSRNGNQALGDPYAPLANCDNTVVVDAVGGAVPYADIYCHGAACFNDPKPGGEAIWSDGCDPTQVDKDGRFLPCCNDDYLEAFCLNTPCNTSGPTLVNDFRHRTRTNVAASGYGLIIRNLGIQPVLVTGNWTVRNVDFPCTIQQCCTNAEMVQCCPSLFTASYEENFGSCSYCQTPGTNGVTSPLFFNTPAQPVCTEYDQTTLDSRSARGRVAADWKAPKTITTRFIPELVAAGHQVISAHSDGTVNSFGGDQIWPQCSVPGAMTKTNNNCEVSFARGFVTTQSVLPQSGSSPAAAQIGGAATVVRQYLAQGYYPTGKKDLTNTAWSNPSASVVRAMLINSAVSAGGSVIVYTYEAEPPCTSISGVCAPWVQPPPTASYVALTTSPNPYEGFGRPELDTVLWFDNSSFTLYIAENSFTAQGMMHTYSFKTLASETPGKPLQVTMVYPDPPAVPGTDSDAALVNDLDLTLQVTYIDTYTDVNTGQLTSRQRFDYHLGNNGTGPDQSNTAEKVILPTYGEVDITVMVTSTRLSTTKGYTPQPYAIVITGQARPKYWDWQPVRLEVLGLLNLYGGGVLTDDSISRTFAYMDVFKRGNLTVQDIQLRLFNVSDTAGRAMMQNADDNRDRFISLSEWATLLIYLVPDSRRMAEPVFTSGPSTLNTTSVRIAFPEAGLRGSHAIHTARPRRAHTHLEHVESMQ